MSNTESKTNLYQNEIYTKRQIESSFRPRIIPPLPSDDMSQLQQQENNNPEYTSTSIMRSDAPVFTPSSVINNTENQMSNSFIYGGKNYKYDYFLSKLSSNLDHDNARFGSPSGICTLDDDRLLVANFDLDSLLLLDINGFVHEIYRNLPTPKDVLYYPSNSSQAVVATSKEMVILDLNTKEIVTRSKLRGFYPWNIQYIKEADIFTACDPSGERIVYFDKNLTEIGGWSFHEPPNPYSSQSYQKVYPYAAYFFPDNTSLVLTHRGDTCQLKEYDVPTQTLKKIFDLPPTLRSYSIYADSERKCLIPDNVNHRLISMDKDSAIEEYKSKSIQEPYSMTFLSTGTLCVTDRNRSFGTNGGIAIISENDLKTNQ